MVFLADEIVDGRHRMGCQKPLGQAGFDRGPHRRAGGSMRLPVQENVQNHIDVNQDPIHRYFSLRCLRYPCRSAFFSVPRTDRSTGGASPSAGPFETDARYASTIRETDMPRWRAYRLAFETTAGLTLRVS